MANAVAAKTSVLQTQYPAALFSIQLTAQSVVNEGTQGAQIYGVVDVILFEQAVQITLSAGQALLATAQDSSGARKLLFSPRIVLRDRVVLSGTGPGLSIRKWSFSKDRTNKATELRFDKFSIWSCGAPGRLPVIPDQHDFELLLPGVGGAAWVQSNAGGGRLVRADKGWAIEHACKLYPFPSSTGEAQITFKPAEGIYFPPLTIWANYRKGAPTRLRVFLSSAATPTALELDAPGAAARDGVIRMTWPNRFALQVDVSPGVSGYLPLERVRIESGRVTGHVHPEVRVDVRLGACASWSMPGVRVQFTAALPLADHDTTSCTAVVFGDRGAAGSIPMADSRFDGLRISGLDSIGRPSEVLEAVGLKAEVLLHAGLSSTKEPLLGLSCAWLGPRANQLSHDARKGVLDVPVDDALLQVSRGAGSAPLDYRLELNRTGGWRGTLTVFAASLQVPPFGGAASTLDSTGSVDWSRYVRMTLPTASKLKATQTSTAPRLALSANWRDEWRLDGEQELLLHEMSNLQTRFTSVSFSRAKPAVKKNATGKAAGDEERAYAVLGLALGYLAAEYDGQGWTKFFETSVKLELSEKALAEWAERNALKDVVVTLDQLSSSADQRTWFRKFVQDNIKKPKPSATGVLWPFASGLGIPLYEGQSPESATWLWDMQRNGKALRCGFAFDYSPQATFTPKRLGLPVNFFQEEAKAHPALWPRSRAQQPGMMPGSVEDPGREQWSGIFIRDVPLVLPEIPSGLTLLQKLRDRVNPGLRLEYGWLDASGHSWKAGWESGGKPARLFPFTGNDPAPPFEILLEALATWGSLGQVVAAPMTLRIVLHGLEDETTHMPIAFIGKAELGFLSGQKTTFELRPTTGSEILTKSLPGFEKLSFKRFRTDFGTSASLEVGLVASKELQEAVPFFTSTELLASVAVPLDSNGAMSMAIRFPADAPTKLFGKWPISIRALEFALGGQKKTSIYFVLDLGAVGIKAAGGVLHITAEGGGLQFDVQLDRIDVDFSAFGVGVEGVLQWRDKGHQSQSTSTYQPAPVPLASAAARDFYGAVRLKGLANTGDAALYLRIGSQGRPFWIAALLVGKNPKIAGKNVDDPAFLLAYGAQQSAGDTLRQVLANPGATLPASLFPTPGQDPVAWLDKWERATDGLGLAVGLSGNFSLEKFLASAPNSGRNLSVLWADTGLFYASAKLNVFGVKPTDFSLLIDFARHFLTAGLQLDGINLGEGVEVSAGFLSFTVAWGREQTGFGFSIGYPPVKTDEDLGMDVPDFSKAVSVRLKDAWPINTFQGGMKAWYFTNPRSYGFGVAVRVGYSNSWKATGSDIADARADVGVMVGGSFLFCGTPSDRILPLQPLALQLEVQALSADEQWLAEMADQFLQPRSGDQMFISASIFGDVWGHAYVVFLGVTIAGIKIDARAAFDVRGELHDGILYMGAEYSFRASVKIGCTSYSTTCRFKVVMINRGSAQTGNCNGFLRDLRSNLLAYDEVVS